MEWYGKIAREWPQWLIRFAAFLFVVSPNLLHLAAASPHLSRLAAASPQRENSVQSDRNAAGIWVKLCASGQSVWVLLPQHTPVLEGFNRRKTMPSWPDNTPPPDERRITACHACVDKRGKTGEIIKMCLAAG